MKAAATQFRSVIMAKEDGDFIGDEREVIQVLGVSRTTLRQIARLLEREGLLSVRRGSSGGYFARRPSPLSVEVAVVDYLEILNVHTEELSAMASMIWIEAVRQAASVRCIEAERIAVKLAKAVRNVDSSLPYAELLRIEKKIRSEVFGLIDSPYVTFMFQVTMRFGEKRSKHDMANREAAKVSPEFVARWHDVKLLELSAIAQGDQELGVLAARRSRDLWRTVSQFQTAEEAI
ncbi:MAG: transcriptional regulator [Novosphingobium sp.]|nr:transcriptional regulator [Novosphingobium sp.]